MDLGIAPVEFEECVVPLACSWGLKGVNGDVCWSISSAGGSLLSRMLYGLLILVFTTLSWRTGLRKGLLLVVIDVAIFEDSFFVC